jgi:hypothetical protein
MITAIPHGNQSNQITRGFLSSGNFIGTGWFDLGFFFQLKRPPSHPLELDEADLSLSSLSSADLPPSFLPPAAVGVLPAEDVSPAA